MNNFVRSLRRNFVTLPLKALRSNIFAGLLLITPIGVTIYVFYKIFDLADSILPKTAHLIVPKIQDNWIPGLGILIFLAIAYIIGLFARNYLGHRIITTGNALIAKIPLISKVYIGIQQVLDAVINNRKNIFQKVVLVEFPRPGCHCLGLMSGPVTGEFCEKIGRDNMTVFVPSGPSPSNGFILFLPSSQIIELAMPVDTALKIIMSAGIFTPDSLKQGQSSYGAPASERQWNWLDNLKRWDRHDAPDPRD